jgi:hypothetical protein
MAAMVPKRLRRIEKEWAFGTSRMYGDLAHLPQMILFAELMLATTPSL